MTMTQPFQPNQPQTVNEQDIDNLVGATIGPWTIAERVRPGRRWIYVLVRADSSELLRLRGHQVVRLVRRARLEGLCVVMPGEAWRDEVKS